ncbi:MAG: CehA/McbA family metallohydrolase [Nakamurella sp.]
MTTHWRGTLTPDDRAANTWHYVPFEIAFGVGAFTITLEYDRSGGAIIDLGCEGPQGFRGWSGGARNTFTITDHDATPGYLPGVAPGGWQVVLGLHRVPPGGVDVSVSLSLGSRHAQPFATHALVAERPPRPDLPSIDGLDWLAGDFHCHTVHSDGQHLIDEVAGMAAEAGLDFLAVTDHNTISHHPFLPAASERSGVQLIPGQEVTTWRGHANAFGDIGWVDFREPADSWIRSTTARGGLLSLNHPVSGDCSWRQPLTERPDLVETWHSSWTDRTSGAPMAFLFAGFPGVTPIGGADFHGRGADALPGYPTSWVLAADGDILGGLRAGRTSITSGPGGPLLLRMGAEFLVIGGDGLLLATPDGYRTPIHGERVTLPARPGLAWLEDERTGVQAISS